MKKFIKRVESFKCQNCHKLVKGDGYTNHCPFCLFSLHVDNNPGDRQAGCGGLMRPMGLIKKNDEFKIIHVCERCKKKKINRLNSNDSRGALSR